MSGIHQAETTTNPNGVTSSGNGDVATNGSVNDVVTHDLAPVTLPMVFVEPSFDEAGIKRLTSPLLKHLGGKARDSSYLRGLNIHLPPNERLFHGNHTLPITYERLCVTVLRVGFPSL